MADMVFERILLPIVKKYFYENQEAKASEVRYRRIENERKYYIRQLKGYAVKLACLE
jgi:hypothetical protein